MVKLGGFGMELHGLLRPSIIAAALAKNGIVRSPYVNLVIVSRLAHKLTTMISSIHKQLLCWIHK